MPKQRNLSVKFPAGGVNKRHGYNKQPPFTSPSANNVWPTNWDTGRETGGSRPGLTAFGSSLANAPYGWTEANWLNNTGVAVVHAGGTHVATATLGWTEKISTAVASADASCTVYLQHLYQAASGQDTRWMDLDLTSTTGTVLAASADNGTAPFDCAIVQTWGDRLVLSGDPLFPQVIYMSRVGEPLDWDYADVDAGGAWANNGATAGKMGENITSLIPHNRDCLLVGSQDALYAVRGNPKGGGQIYSLSNSVGPLGQNAWCKTANDFTVMMTRDGLYSMRPGCGEPPVSMSREALPDELLAIDPYAGDRVSIAYDARFRGIHIYVNYNSGTDVHYFYDTQNKGFWPMSFDVTKALAVNLKSAASTTKSGLLAIDTTGVASQFDTASFESQVAEVAYGPIPLGTPHTEGILTEIAVVLAAGSEDVSLSAYEGDSYTAAYAGGELFSTLTVPLTGDGLQHVQNPMVRGTNLYLILAADRNSGTWSAEEINLTIRAAGKRRVG